MASGYDCVEELLEEFKHRYTMHPTNRYDSMICSRNFHHLVTTEEQRVLALTCKRADETFSYGVVDAVTSAIQVAKQLFPQSMEIAQGFFPSTHDGQDVYPGAWHQVYYVDVRQVLSSSDSDDMTESVLVTIYFLSTHVPNHKVHPCNQGYIQNPRHHLVQKHI